MESTCGAVAIAIVLPVATNLGIPTLQPGFGYFWLCSVRPHGPRANFLRGAVAHDSGRAAPNREQPWALARRRQRASFHRFGVCARKSRLQAYCNITGFWYLISNRISRMENRLATLFIRNYFACGTYFGFYLHSSIRKRDGEPGQRCKVRCYVATQE